MKLKTDITPKISSPECNEKYLSGNINTDGDGNIYLLTGGGVIVFSPSGEFLFNAVPGIENVRTNTQYEIYEKHPSDDSGYLFYLKIETGLMGVTDTDATEIINWSNSDIDQTSINSMIMLADGRVFYDSFDWHTLSHSMGILSKIPDDEVTPKYVIKLAYISDGSGGQTLASAAVKFNRSSDKYKVILVPYAVAYDSEVTAVSVLNNDIITGKIPDLFLFDPYFFTPDVFSIANYESKQMFVDLYDYINNDSAFPASNLLNCATTPFERDGKLYRLPLSVSVQTTIATRETAARFENWTLTDFLGAEEDCRNRGVSLMTGTILYQLQNYIRELVDEENGTCSFESDEFVRLLNFVKGQNSEFNYEEMFAAETSGYRNGSVLLRNLTINYIPDLLHANSAFGTQKLTDLAFAGFPGNEVLITEQSSYAISAMSAKETRDGAWEYIKFVMADENRPKDYGAIPSTRSALEKLIKEEMQSYYLLSITETNVSTNSWSAGDRTDTPPPAEFTAEPTAANFPTRFTREDADMLMEYLDTAVGIKSMDQKIIDMINEEVDIYLGGSKSAEETAAIIQSRVAIYLSESH